MWGNRETGVSGPVSYGREDWQVERGTGAPSPGAASSVLSLSELLGLEFISPCVVLRSVVTAPYGHRPDSRSLKILTRACRRRETSRIRILSLL